MWENNGWVIETETSLETDKTGEIYALGATITANGNLAVVFAVDGEDSTLFHTSRTLELPAVRPEPIPTLTPTPQPTSTPAPTLTPTPTPTVALPTQVPPSNSPLPGPGSGAGDSIGVALSFLPAVILVGVAFFFGLRAVRGGQR